MNLSDEQKKEIKELAELQKTPRAIALILGLEVEAFERQALTEYTEAWNAVQAGYETADLTLRRAIYGQAKAGSTAAIEQFQCFQREVKLYERNHRHKRTQGRP
ncbi:MAG: hypothetical protein AAF740_01605 [Bacteroidota bacterium]